MGSQGICPKCKGNIDNSKEMMPDWTTCEEILRKIDCKSCIGGTTFRKGSIRICWNCGRPHNEDGSLIILKEGTLTNLKKGSYRETWSGVSRPEDR